MAVIKDISKGAVPFRKKVLIEVMRLNIKTNQGIGIKSIDESLMSSFEGGWTFI